MQGRSGGNRGFRRYRRDGFGRRHRRFLLHGFGGSLRFFGFARSRFRDKGFPQEKQNLASSAAWAPHTGQVFIGTPLRRSEGTAGFMKNNMFIISHPLQECKCRQSRQEAVSQRNHKK